MWLGVPNWVWVFGPMVILALWRIEQTLVRIAVASEESARRLDTIKDQVEEAAGGTHAGEVATVADTLMRESFARRAAGR